MTAAILLAAGASARMGRPKALLDWRGAPLIRWQAEQLAAACGLVIPVLGARAPEIAAALPVLSNIRPVRNRAWQRGRSSSIRTAARAVPANAQTIVIASVDQPTTTEIVQILLARLQDDPTTQIALPRRNDRNGHPIALRADLLPQLLQVNERTQGLKSLRRQQAANTAFIETDDPVILLDLNSPADYERAAHTAMTADGC